MESPSRSGLSPGPTALTGAALREFLLRLVEVSEILLVAVLSHICSNMVQQ